MSSLGRTAKWFLRRLPRFFERVVEEVVVAALVAVLFIIWTSPFRQGIIQFDLSLWQTLLGLIIAILVMIEIFEMSEVDGPKDIQVVCIILVLAALAIIISIHPDTHRLAIMLAVTRWIVTVTMSCVALPLAFFILSSFCHFSLERLRYRPI